MIKTMKIRAVLPVLILFSCTSVRNEKPAYKEPVKASFEIIIEQNDRTISELNGFYPLEDQKFDILVKNAGDKTINIFAYHNEEMFQNYTFPVECKKTVMFHPGTAIIDNADKNKEITLALNREMQYNLITPEKRIDNNNTAQIKIRDIADTDNQFNGALYLTFLVDFNNDNVIEENEVKNISLKINKSASGALFKGKVHVSTIGSWLKDIDYPVYSNEYSYVKITNEAEKQKFFQLFGHSNFTNPYSKVNRIADLDCTKYNMYVVFSPITKDMELSGNPYHYSGDNKLIFETRINKEANRGVYVYCREYRVEKSLDIFELWINDKGKLRTITQVDSKSTIVTKPRSKAPSL
jgi:hypothetical protein